MNYKKINILLIAVLIILSVFIVYQNFFTTDSHSTETKANANEEQLWTCGMHPDIVVNEPGNCPICGMKLTPLKNNNTSKSSEKEIIYWAAPMNPNEIYDEPGKSKMGMDLVPVYADQAAQSGVVTIDPAVQQNMNVKFTTIEMRTLSPSIETNAVITTDERNEHQITARVGGWIEKLYVNYTGQIMTPGDKLLDIYSPELVSAQQEYLTALNYKQKVSNIKNVNLSESGDDLIKYSYRKLQLLKMTDDEIEILQKTNQVKTSTPLYSNVKGTVLMKNVIEGEKIIAGQNLLHIADLSTLWVIADLYESDINSVKTGNPVTITVDSFPGQKFEGKVSFIDPTIDPKTRTAKVRIDLANTGYKLKPAMLANVKFHTGNKNAAAVIPETAVIRSGHLTTAVQFLGDGKFKPVKVQLGNFADGLYQVLSGLKPGDKVVTSAQFLIDSESSLKTAMKNFREPKTNKSSNMNMATDSVQSPLIRKGTIDLKSIDKNNDGMVYQDLMDWNVISDEPGKCPICEMKLSKVSIKEAAKNLIEHGFKINELMDGNSKINDKQMNHENHEHTKIENEYGIESPLIRTGKINLEAIDKNGDGKLWECPMDWNIIGDEYQRCPVCEMKMKEYLIDDVKANLDKHGYEYK